MSIIDMDFDPTINSLNREVQPLSRLNSTGEESNSSAGDSWNNPFHMATFDAHAMGDNMDAIQEFLFSTGYAADFGVDGQDPVLGGFVDAPKQVPQFQSQQEQLSFWEPMELGDMSTLSTWLDEHSPPSDSFLEVPQLPSCMYQSAQQCSESAVWYQPPLQQVYEQTHNVMLNSCSSSSSLGSSSCNLSPPSSLNDLDGGLLMLGNFGQDCDFGDIEDNADSKDNCAYSLLTMTPNASPSMSEPPHIPTPPSSGMPGLGGAAGTGGGGGGLEDTLNVLGVELTLTTQPTPPATPTSVQLSPKIYTTFSSPSTSSPVPQQRRGVGGGSSRSLLRQVRVLDGNHLQLNVRPIKLERTGVVPFNARGAAASTASFTLSAPPFSSSSPMGLKDKDEKVYTCHYANCNKVYSKSSHLKAHLRRHTGEKPFKCNHPTCSWKFSRSDELARHKRSHSGDKPYSCEQCPKRFSRSDHLSKHRKVHLKNSLKNGAQVKQEQQA